MKNSSDALLGLTTCGSEEEAAGIARALLDSRLAACVNLLPRVRSLYRWEGKVEDAAETLLLIKTRAALLDALTAEVRRLHSYELPEIIALPVAAGLPPYLAWIVAETAQP